MASSQDTSVTRPTRDSNGLSVRETVVAAVAGLSGMVAMAPVFAVAFVLGVMQPRAVTGLAQLFGFGADTLFAESAFVVGTVVFVAAGATILPLLFVSLAQYLPPVRNVPLRGVTYGTIIWSGFVVAFYTNQAGATFLGYLALTLLAHWVYGGVMGWVYTRFAELPVFRV